MRISTVVLAGVMLAGLSGAASAQAGPALRCVAQRPDSTLKARVSPYDSLKFTVSGRPAQLCYGRPSARGRKMIGGTEVAFGELWRTGANEPTILHISTPAMIAGLHVEPGSYSIYTVPGATEWEVIVNRSITQWGEESSYTDAVKAQEVGRGKVRSETIANPIETLTFRVEPVARGADLILEWETTRVRIPIRLM